MEKNVLTGIERELVLQYLIDGNVPVTLTPMEIKKTNEEKIYSLNSQVFPVAIKGENLRVYEDGVIHLENPPHSISNFKTSDVKVEFYFNRVGLFFESKVKETKDGLSIEIPKEINRIADFEEEHLYDFSAVIYFDFKNKTEINLNCVPWNTVELFERPVWKSIPLENQKTAKNYLEQFVANAKIEHNAGNGIQLIPICNYLTFNNVKMESLEKRIKPYDILYIDHERIVLGYEKNTDFSIGEEYGIKLVFSLKKGPVLSRDIFVTCLVNKIYKEDDLSKTCIDLRYTTIQEEDLRYIYEKCTKNLLK